MVSGQIIAVSLDQLVDHLHDVVDGQLRGCVRLQHSSVVDEVALLPEMTLPEYMEKVKNVVEKMPEDSLILTDIFGGTTTNVAAKLGRDYNIKVYSGLCAPMLIEACSGLAFAGKIDQSAVLEAGQGAVRDVVDEVLKSLNKEN